MPDRLRPAAPPDAPSGDGAARADDPPRAEAARAPERAEDFAPPGWAEHVAPAHPPRAPDSADRPGIDPAAPQPGTTPAPLAEDAAAFRDPIAPVPPHLDEKPFAPDPPGAGTTEPDALAPAELDDLPPVRAELKLPFSWNPLKPYRGIVRRFFLVYKHVLGLLLSGAVAYVRALPSWQKSGLRNVPVRFAAFVTRPFLDKEILRLPYPQQLRRRLELLGPTFIKLGQVLAIREDLLPPVVTDELKNLFDRLPNVPYAEVRRIVARDLGSVPERLFAHFEPEPLGSASIAQAHRATTHEGDRVVVKVIKPGIRDVIESDLKMLEILGYGLEKVIPRYQPQMIIEEFAAYTRKEVDYAFEADHAEIFTANFSDRDSIIFPRIYRSLSGEEVLTMEFFEGFSPSSPSAQALPPEDRERLVDLGAEAIICMLFRDGFFHADLHAGNLMVLPPDAEHSKLRLGFIDLGMVGRFEQQTRRRMLYYFHALVRGDIEDAAKYLADMARPGKGGDPEGFRRAVEDVARRFRMHSADGEASIAQLIMQSTSLSGRFRVFFPVEMTLMVKALVTFEGVGRTLDPHLDIAEVSERHVRRIFRDHFDPRHVTRDVLARSPEMLDLLVRLPELLSTGVRLFEERVVAPSESPLRGLRSSILAGSCVVGAVLALTQGAAWFVWGPLFLAALVLARKGG